MIKKKTFLILDGNALLHRAWHAIPPLTSPDGRVVNAAYGFTNVIEKMRTDFKPDYMAVAWDLPGATFRHKAFEAYKATREKKDQALYDQIPIIQEILDAYNIPSLSVEGMEADDIIGTLSKKFGPDKDVLVLILTGDMDALQLVDKDVEVVAFIKGLSETKRYDITAVKERYGLVPEQLIDLKTLMGDTSDNIPGIAGIGKKTATLLIQEYGSLEGILEAIKKDLVPEKFAKKFRGQEENIKMMKMLVTVVCDVKLPGFSIAKTKVEAPDVSTLVTLFENLGFRRLLEKYNINELDLKPKKNKINKEKTEKIKFVRSLSDLDDKIISFAVDVGPQDLFGGSVRAISISDGKKVFLSEHPDKTNLKEIIKYAEGVNELVMHDAKSVMHCVGYISHPIFDTMVASYLLKPGSRTFDLQTVAREHLNQQITDSPSAQEQSEVIYSLFYVLKKGLETEKMIQVAREIDMPLIPILYKMEQKGIAIDKNKLNDLSVEFGNSLDELTKKIYKLAGREFNLNSPSQLADVLFVDLELQTKGIKKTKTGFSTAASELEKLWDEHKIIPLMSEYREFAKLKSTYVDSLPLLIASDGRIHSSFNQTITATGRLSSSDPNLQNIPTRTLIGQEIRKAFVASPGNILVSIDYSQFELRLAASMSKDELFIKAFNEGADIHRRTAAEVLEKSEDDVTKQERAAAKAINFGILYGMGARNLARSTGFSQAEARAFIERYFDVHSGLRDYIELAKETAHKKGYVETMFGRRRYLPDIQSGIQQLVASAERMAVNMPIQGSQADLVKMAMIKVESFIEKTDYHVDLLLQVHDELVFEVAKSEMDNVIPELKRIMENIWKSDVPLLVDVEIGENWGDQSDWK